MSTRVITFLLAFVMTLNVTVLTAQNRLPPVQTNSPQQTQSEQRSPFEDPDAWTRLLDTMEQAVSREGVRDNDLDRLFDEARAIRDAAALRVRELLPLVAQAQRRLDRLGPVPEEGSPSESAELQERRAQLNSGFAEVDAQLKQAQLNEVRAQQVQKTISDLRNKRFVQAISQRTAGISTTEFWREFARGFSGFGRGLYLLLTDSLNVFVNKITDEYRSSLLLTLLIVIIGFVYARLLRFLREFTSRPGYDPGSEFSRPAPTGFLLYLQNGVMPALLPYVAYRVFSGLGLLTPRLDQLLFTVVVAIGFGVAAFSLFRIYLSPGDSGRRLISLSDSGARRMFSIITMGLSFALLLFVLERVTVVLVSPIEVSLGLSLFFALVVAGYGNWAMAVARKDRKQAIISGMVDTPVLEGKQFWFYLIRLLWVLAVVILIAALTGYIAFAEFLSEQLLFGLIVVLSTWLLLRFVDHVLFTLPAASEQNEEAVEPDEGSPFKKSRQYAILISGLVKSTIYLVGAVLMLLPWGYRTSDFFQFFKDVFFGFEIGGLSFSLSTVLLALLLFAIGYTVTVASRNWLNNRFLPTTNLDIGISNSISTIFGYTGFLLAALFAITAAGFDLSSLAIVAGALSVGVGFGLQSIVNNFVSGLILLAERPIKVDDWVVTSGGQGYVKRISVRSTEIETFDRSTVIVPNSTLITDSVTNWTHEGKSGRIRIAVGVSYDSDPEQVREILLECAGEHGKVLGRPAPAVMFMDFGASSLDFELRCFVGDINYGLSISSELRFAIFKALADANIEIPFPQTDLHIRTGPPDILFPPDAEKS